MAPPLISFERTLALVLVDLKPGVGAKQAVAF
jgi:hypothetical protein